MPAYYVQDYEPWFTCSPFDCPFKSKLTIYNRLFNKPLVTKESHFKYTSSTYSAVNGRVFLFAKTNWIKNMVEKFHKNTLVHLVVPSIDHTVYYPDQDTINSKSKQARIMSLSMNMKSSSSSSIAAVRGTLKIKVIAMLRPRTPRRNTMTCLDTLLKLAYDYQSMVQVSFFGVDKILFGKLMSDLVDRDGPARHRSAKNIKVLGLLKQRLDLANLYRKSDVFVDMSWWQAFGRTAVEAMACGCVPIMPSVGAASDVCDGGYVCPYHDGTDPTGYYEVIELLVHNHTERLRLVKAGIEKSHGYSIRKAANSIEIALNGGLLDYRKANY